MYYSAGVRRIIILRNWVWELIDQLGNYEVDNYMITTTYSLSLHINRVRGTWTWRTPKLRN
jgi:hypothetical protein